LRLWAKLAGILSRCLISNELVDAETLGAFADTLRRLAAPVAEVMGPGLSEDEIRSICAEASLEPSQDAIAWFTVWDAKPHEARSSTASRFGEVLPGFQAAPLRACVKASVWYREFAEQEVGSLRPLGIEPDDLWPRAWLLMFGDGRGLPRNSRLPRSERTIAAARLLPGGFLWT
jgi:hypothetical protein